MSQDGVGRTSAFLSGVGSMRRGWRPPSTPTQKAVVTRRRTAVTKVFIDTSSFSSVTGEVSSVPRRGSIDLHAAREAEEQARDGNREYDREHHGTGFPWRLAMVDLDTVDHD